MSELEWMKLFANNLKAAMKKQGYTQKSLADATGISESSINTYVNAKKTPGIKAIMNISYELDIPCDEFIDFGDRID